MSLWIGLTTMRGDVQCGEISFSSTAGRCHAGKGKQGGVTRGGTIAPVITVVILFYNTERPYFLGMAINYKGKKFFNKGPWSILMKSKMTKNHITS